MKFLKLLFCLSALLFWSCSAETEQEILSKLKDIPFGFSKNEARLLKDGEALITVPNGRRRNLPVLFVFGGLYYANPSFMTQQVPGSFFKKAVIVFAPCAQKGGFGYDFYMGRIRKMLEKEGITLGKVTVCGFSAGGPDAIIAKDKDIKLIGLIDPNPVIPSQNKTKARIIAAYNIANWHDNSPALKMSIQKQFSDYAHWAKQKGGIVEENSVQHQIFPKYFFYRYRSRLLN
jgi:hypothetical protein